MARRLLVTGTLGRPDIVAAFERVAPHCELTFVEYERNWGDGLSASVYAPYGRLTTWEEHRSARALLRETKPDLVAMMYLSSLNQVALRAAAREEDIEVVHIEHGYRLPPDHPLQVQGFAGVDNAVRLSGWRTHRFFARSLVSMPPRLGTQLTRYAVDLKRHGASLAVLRASADLRRADRYLSYSPECFEYHRLADAIGDRTCVEFTGVPGFDDFTADAPGDAPDALAILIDNQLHNAGVFGWTLDRRRAHVREIADVTKAAGLRLLVKTHPGDTSGAWTGLVESGDAEVVERHELPALAGRTRFVLGTFSTMQMPLAAMPNSVLLTLEDHPEQGAFPSRRFVEAGVGHPVFARAELEEALTQHARLLDQQRPRKPDFVTRFLHRLDGNSGARMAAGLLRQPGSKTGSDD